MSSSDLHEFFASWQYGATRLALNWLVQSTALIALGLLAGRILRAKGAAVQSAIYRTTLAAVLLCPVASLLLLSAGIDGLTATLPSPVLSVRDIPHRPKGTPADHVNGREDVPASAAPDLATHVLEDTGAPRGHTPAVPAVSANRPSPERQLASGPDRAKPSTSWADLGGVLACVLTAAWPVVSGLLLLRLLVAYGLTARLRRRACGVDPESISRCSALAGRMGVRAPPVLQSLSVTSPCLFGLLRPAILLPHAEEGESSAESAVLAHELAHLARRDCLWNLLNRASVAILFFQPLLWVLSRLLSRSSEEVCDDHVIALGFDSRDYARRLADIARRYQRPVSAAAVAVVSLRSWLGRRVVRILDSSRTLSTGVGRRPLAAIGVAAIASTALVGTFAVRGTRAEEAPAASTVNARRDVDNKVDGKDPPPKGSTLLWAFGTVVDTDGKPVAGAKVYLREWSSLRVSDNPYDKNPQDVLATVQTAADGKFRFAKVPAPPFERDWNDPVPWDVVVVADGYGMAWRHLRSAEDKTPMALRLPAEAKLTGRVVDGQGRPIVGAEVSVSAIGDLGRRISDLIDSSNRLDLGESQLEPRVRTDGEGRFAIGRLPPEKRFMVIAEHDQYALKWAYAATSDQPQPDVLDWLHEPDQTAKVHTGDFTVELEPGYQINGRVLMADTKRACPGAKVWLSWKSAGHFAIADAQGRFAFRSLYQPEWNVSARTPQGGDYLRRRIHVALSENQRQAEVEIHLPRGQVVTGSVVDETTRKGVPGVGVSTQDPVPDDAPDRLFTSGMTTGDDGTFRVVVPPGRGLLCISGPVDGYHVPSSYALRQDENPDPRFVRWIDIRPGEDVPKVHFTVTRGLIVSGYVADPDGQPVAGAEVKTLSIRPYKNFKKAATQTDEGGRFTLAGLPFAPGQWLEIKHGRRRLIGRFPIEAEGLVESAEPLSMDVRIQPAATARGRVLVDGQPTAGVRVSLSPAREFSSEMYTGSADYVLTDDSGRFEFDFLPPGKGYQMGGSSREFIGQRSPTFPLEPGQTHELPALELQRRDVTTFGTLRTPEGK